MGVYFWNTDTLNNEIRNMTTCEINIKCEVINAQISANLKIVKKNHFCQWYVLKPLKGNI